MEFKLIQTKPPRSVKLSNCWNYKHGLHKEKQRCLYNNHRRFNLQIKRFIKILKHTHFWSRFSNFGNNYLYMSPDSINFKALFRLLFHLLEFMRLYFPAILLINTTKENHRSQNLDLLVIVLLSDHSWYIPQIIFQCLLYHPKLTWFLLFPFLYKHRLHNVQDTQPCLNSTKFILTPWFELMLQELKHLRSIQISNYFYLNTSFFIIIL